MRIALVVLLATLSLAALAQDDYEEEGAAFEAPATPEPGSRLDICKSDSDCLVVVAPLHATASTHPEHPGGSGGAPRLLINGLDFARDGPRAVADRLPEWFGPQDRVARTADGESHERRAAQREFIFKYRVVAPTDTWKALGAVPGDEVLLFHAGDWAAAHAKKTREEL